jgi:gamma-glutamyltranspeptidase/glutathione hydrolase
VVQEYLQKRAALIDLKKSSTIRHGNPINSSDTVYLATADKDGNSCSFIASHLPSHVWYPPDTSS